MSTTASKQRQAATERSRLTPHGLHPNLHNQEIEHLINGLQQGNHMICSLDQGKRLLRHDGDVDDLDMYNKGHVNNITKNGTCGISTGWSGHSLHCAYLSLLPNRDRKLTQQVSTVVPNSAEYGKISGSSPRKLHITVLFRRRKGKSGCQKRGAHTLSGHLRNHHHQRDGEGI